MKLLVKKSLSLLLAFALVLTMTSTTFAQEIEEIYQEDENIIENNIIENSNEIKEPEAIQEEVITEPAPMMKIMGISSQEFTAQSGILTAIGSSTNGHLTARYAWISPEGEILVAFLVTGPAYQKTLVNFSYNGSELFTGQGSDLPQEGIDYFEVSNLIVNGNSLGTSKDNWLVVNPNYEDREGSATVTITKRDITIKANSATKAYDGTLLIKNEFTITNGKLVTGENITVVISGSQTSVGSSKNTIQSISIKSGDKDVTGNYSITKVEGTLTVNSQVIPPYYPPEEVDEEVPTDLPQLTNEYIAYIQGYPDNTVRPLGYITREEVAAVFYRLLDAEYRSMVFTTNQNFLDVKATRWSNKHIATLANAEIILGYKDGTFRPGNYITRAELAVIASRFDNLSPFESDKFSDIKGHWANKYINSAAEKGWVKRYADGTFKPDNYTTRAEFVTLVNAVLDGKVTKDYILEDSRQFPDLTEEKWYYEDMQEAINSHEYEWLEDNTEKWTKIYYPDLDM